MPGADTDFDEKVEMFVNDLKSGRMLGSYNIASTTVKLLRRLVAQCKPRLTVRDLMDVIRKEGFKLMMAQPSETIVGNMVRKVLKIVREEYARSQGKCEEGEIHESLQKLLLDEGNGEPDDYQTTLHDLKPVIIEGIGELLTELETSTDNISMQALEHIHSKEVIMTAGRSRTVEAFLKHAARKKRKFEVIVAECAPFYHGQDLACSLAKADIATTVITDSAVFAMMARVNKVIMGTHTVMANGGLKAVNGCHAVALAAKHYSVPFIVCTPMYKLSPEYLCSYDQDAFNKFESPHNVMQFSEGCIISQAQIYNPIYDYVPPELVTLYISNIGGNAPSYVYRLLNEMYHPGDLELGDSGQ